MCTSCSGGIGTITPGADFRKTGPDGEHGVAVPECILCRRYGRRAKTHAGVQWVVSRESLQAL